MSQAPAQREEPSMEDILSSIRKIIQSNDDSGEDAPADAAPELVVEDVKAPVTNTSEVQVEPVQQHAPAEQIQAPVSDEGELTSAPERAREVVSAPMEITSEAEIETDVDEPCATEGDPQIQQSANSALISAGPQAKVVASFAQLNEAITASSSQSLEEMANDLLKPMLQEWLDNNLPGLVEKLVREEIERVARGGQES